MSAPRTQGLGHLLIGLGLASEEVFSGFTRGYVYEYQRSGMGAGATWTQLQRFRPTTPTNTSVFGSALALSPTGGTLLVGALIFERKDITS